MKIVIPNKEEFLTNFLNPLSRINDSAIFKLSGNTISSLIGATDGSLFLNAVYTTSESLEETKINLPYLSKLIKVLNCVSDNSITFEYSGNFLQYRSDTIKFKYHLLEDGIINSPSINMEKVNSFNYTTSFTLELGAANAIIKGATFATESNKLYFHTRDGAIFGELTDKKKKNIDSIEYKMCNEFIGKSLDNPIPVSFETIRLVTNSKLDKYLVNVSDTGVLLFRGETEVVKMSYVVASLAE